MTERVSLRPTPRLRAWWVALALFLIIGVAGNVTLSSAWDASRVVGLVFLLTIALLVLAGAFFGRLELTPDGFRVWRLGGGRFTPWRDVDDLRIERGLHGILTITFVRRPATDDRPAILRRISPRLGIPIQYGLSATEQLRLLESWRQRWST